MARTQWLGPAEKKVHRLCSSSGAVWHRIFLVMPPPAPQESCLWRSQCLVLPASVLEATPRKEGLLESASGIGESAREVSVFRACLLVKIALLLLNLALPVLQVEPSTQVFRNQLSGASIQNRHPKGRDGWSWEQSWTVQGMGVPYRGRPSAACCFL